MFYQERTQKEIDSKKTDKGKQKYIDIQKEGLKFIDNQGKQKKKYEYKDMMTPYDKFKSISDHNYIFFRTRRDNNWILYHDKKPHCRVQWISKNSVTYISQDLPPGLSKPQGHKIWETKAVLFWNLLLFVRVYM